MQSHVIALGIQTNSQIHSHYTRSSHHYGIQFARVKIKQFPYFVQDQLYGINYQRA